MSHPNNQHAARLRAIAADQLGMDSDSADVPALLAGAEALEASVWQPIETAPKDGSYVDLWVCNARVPDCRWVDGAWLCYAPNDFESMDWCRIDLEGEPTHWMREPSAPEALTRLEGK